MIDHIWYLLKAASDRRNANLLLAYRQESAHTPPLLVQELFKPCFEGWSRDHTPAILATLFAPSFALRGRRRWQIDFPQAVVRLSGAYCRLELERFGWAQRRVKFGPFASSWLNGRPMLIQKFFVHDQNLIADPATAEFCCGCRDFRRINKLVELLSGFFITASRHMVHNCLELLGWRGDRLVRILLSDHGHLRRYRRSWRFLLHNLLLLGHLLLRNL